MVVCRAQPVTAANPTWLGVLARKQSVSSRGLFGGQNGFDEDDIPSPQVLFPREAFEVTHVGSLYASRNPESLRRVLQRLRANDAIPDWQVQLVGTVDPNVWQSLDRHGLSALTESVPYVLHTEAITYMRQARLLVLSIEAFLQAEGMMTGKIYEYLASGPQTGEAAILLRKTEGGRAFGWDDVAGNAQYALCYI